MGASLKHGVMSQTHIDLLNSRSKSKLRKNMEISEPMHYPYDISSPGSRVNIKTSLAGSYVDIDAI
jgi:hypothetical protein